MRYEAYFLCDICGHKWKTYYDRYKSLERGDTCENCLKRPSANKNFSGTVAETYLIKRLDK